MKDADLDKGWPFLVARGRRHGYRPLLIPRFLAELDDVGVLNHLGRRSPAFRRLSSGTVASFVSETRLLRRSDLVAAQTVDASPAQSDLVLDEHGRPIELLYGLAFDAPYIDAVAQSDLHNAESDAIATHERFLVDEDGFEPVISEQRHVAVTRRTASYTEADVRPPHENDPLGGGEVPRPETPPAPPPPLRRFVAMGAIVLGAIAVVAFLQWPRHQPIEFTPTDSCAAIRPGATCSIGVMASEEVMLTAVGFSPRPANGWNVTTDGHGQCPLHAQLPKPCVIDVTVDPAAGSTPSSVKVVVDYVVGSEPDAWERDVHAVLPP